MFIEEMKKELSGIDKNKVADEIFWWLKENVVNYIDTHTSTYSLSFLAHEEKMSETAKIEHLFSKFNAVDMKQFEGMTDTQIMESPELTQDALNQEAINDFMAEVKDIMLEKKKSLEDLFKDLSQYYALTGFYRGSPLIKAVEGYIDIEYLSFENLSLDVTKTPVVLVCNKEGQVIGSRKDESKKEILAKMPPSFCIDISITLWEDKNETSIF